MQKTPNFALRDAGKNGCSIRTVYIYRRERAQGDQLLLSSRSQGLEGWAPASAVLPLAQAEAFFSEQIQHNPDDSFSFLMRGVVRFEDDDLDHALADLNEALRLDASNVSALVAPG